MGTMKMTITAAAALIGLAAAFGPAGTASAASLPDGTPVIEVGGRHFDGQRSGLRASHRGDRRFGQRSDRRFGHRGDRRRFGHRRGHRGYARGYGHRRGHGHGHNYYGPFIYGGIALGTYLFLDALDHH
jgi:hypothetical protein